jgi:hypothetical protein
VKLGRFAPAGAERTCCRALAERLCKRGSHKRAPWNRPCGGGGGRDQLATLRRRRGDTEEAIQFDAGPAILERAVKRDHPKLLPAARTTLMRVVQASSIPNCASSFTAGASELPDCLASIRQLSSVSIRKLTSLRNVVVARPGANQATEKAGEVRPRT